MRTRFIVMMMVCLLGLVILPGSISAMGVVDTGQSRCYAVNGQQIPCPSPGEALFGQDANYVTTAPAYQDNGDGTITDLNTGLIWQKTPGDKIAWDTAIANAATFNLAGYTDWRVPTIKELYSLMDFDGMTQQNASSSIPYIDTTYFDFEYGDTASGERMIDAQYWSSTQYVSTTMNGSVTVFGVNFADGRIKGYGIPSNGSQNQHPMFVRYVRGGTGYGVNSFVDNGTGTITDQSTQLTWMQQDSGSFGVGSRGNGSLNWEEALSWCENLEYAGYNDWRLPDAKELQGIVDYTRSSDTTGSAAISPLFSVTPIVDGLGQTNYPYFWTSTTHVEGPGGNYAVYVAFGEAQGYMELPPNSGNPQLMDVHGAGAQRSDPKSGDPADYPTGHGPQGDVIGIYNYARCVRGGDYQIFTGGEVDTNLTGAPAGGNGQPPGNGNGQPPTEAINACSGSSQGATCSFNAPNGMVNGTCQPAQNQLACVPQGGPQGGRPGGG